MDKHRRVLDGQKRYVLDAIQGKRNFSRTIAEALEEVRDLGYMMDEAGLAKFLGIYGTFEKKYHDKLRGKIMQEVTAKTKYHGIDPGYRGSNYVFEPRLSTQEDGWLPRFGPHRPNRSRGGAGRTYRPDRGPPPLSRKKKKLPTPPSKARSEGTRRLLSAARTLSNGIRRAATSETGRSIAAAAARMAANAVTEGMGLPPLMGALGSPQAAVAALPAAPAALPPPVPDRLSMREIRALRRRNREVSPMITD